jgi:hypothetical protein
VELDTGTTAGDVVAHIAANARRSAADFVLVLLQSRKPGCPYNGSVLSSDECLLEAVEAIEAAGRRFKLLFHVRTAPSSRGLRLVFAPTVHVCCAQTTRCACGCTGAACRQSRRPWTLRSTSS